VNPSAYLMDVRIPLTVTLSGSAHHVHVEITGTARVEELATALARAFDLATPPHLAGARGPLDPAAPLASAGVRAGAVLHLSTRPDGWGGQAGGSGRQLRVVAGPDAGLVMRLPATGTLTVGRSAENEVRLTASGASRRHAALHCRPDAVELVDTGSAHGTILDGTRLARPTTWAPGTAAQIGADRIVLLDGDDPTDPEPATLTTLPDGRVRFTRPHRFVPPAPARSVRFPRRPAPASRTSGAFGLGALSGLVLGVVAYFVWHNLTFLLFSAISTATLGASAAGTWWVARRQHARERRRYTEARERQQTELATLVVQEHARLTREAPDVLRVALTADRTGARLWERRPGHDDFLRLRLGVADQPSGIEVVDPDADQALEADRIVAPDLTGVPVTVDLAAHGAIGLTGPRDLTRAVARWLVAQATVQSGPADLTVVVLTRPGAPDAAAAWDWVRWLPHARPETGPLARVGADEASLHDQVSALVDLITARRQPGPARRYQSNVLMVLDDLGEYDVPGLAEVLGQGPDAGVFTIALDQLPYRCPVVAAADAAGTVLLRQAGAPDLAGVVADQVSPVVAERIGRALAPLADPEAHTGAGGLPGEVALLDLVPGVTPDDVAARWARTPRQTRVVLGRTADGPLFVDLVAHGPHALVAGATGWGKSALLQSLVASLALANRPDELGFILVDFKGGAAFAAFTDLPHTVGSISNLDGHQVMRALDSLAGEMERRQRALAAAGVEKLEQFQQLGNRLHRLLVVIDEFALLKEQLPAEILTRLIHVATQGRSLGLHLVIGTQTPRGVVPPEIRPNINLQVALHLPTEHSQDVVGVPDASGLTVKGRAYLRRGEDAEVTLFQSAFLGGRTRRAPGQALRVLRAPWERLGHPPADPGTSTVRDIDLLVSTIREAARLDGVDRPARPWLPELPVTLPLSDVDSPAPFSIVYGREDHPEQRAQPVAAWRLTGGTHLLAAGRPRSGRTTLLRTLAAAVARDHRPDELHLYVMDCGARLSDLAELPHTGAVVGPSEPDRGVRLLDRLEHLIASREQGSSGPRTLLFIDDWETWQQTFGELDHGDVHEQLLRIARKGPSTGVHLAVTGASGLLSSGRARPLVEAASDRLALAFDEADYAWLGVPLTALPKHPRAGQAVRIQRPHRTVQIAVAGLPPVAGGASVAGGPWRVDPLPDRLTGASARALPRPVGSASAAWIPFGAGGDELALLGADLRVDGPAAFVAGERRSGRSTALLGIAADLIARGTEVVVFAPLPTSRLRELSGSPGVAAVLGARQPTARQAQLALAASGTRPCVVLVDDAEQLTRTEAATVLREHLLAGAPLVVATTLDDVAAPAPGGLLADLAGGPGLLLGPRTARPMLFGASTRLPEAYLGAEPIGRAVLLHRRGATPVRVPDADPVPPPVRPGRVPALLGATDALAGPMPSTVDTLRSIVDGLRDAGFADLDDAAVARVSALAPGWSGTPKELLASASRLDAR
jgi:DNA segregation ATPase FtsK/SpoIIIE, S-DNA-T family